MVLHFMEGARQSIDLCEKRNAPRPEVFSCGHQLKDSASRSSSRSRNVFVVASNCKRIESDKVKNSSPLSTENCATGSDIEGVLPNSLKWF